LRKLTRGQRRLPMNRTSSSARELNRLPFAPLDFFGLRIVFKGLRLTILISLLSWQAATENWDFATQGKSPVKLCIVGVAVGKIQHAECVISEDDATR
jgi:hypothetical protein